MICSSWPDRVCSSSSCSCSGDGGSCSGSGGGGSCSGSGGGGSCSCSSLDSIFTAV